MKFDLIVIGGGAAGFFCAIQSAERNPNLSILILEKSKELLSKVRISGGGRCNVTHACFDPSEMVNYYPRGHKELLGPFHSFLCGDMMAWLSDHGVETKIEDDGRVFPNSNTSTSIIDCFLNLCKKYKIEIITRSGVEKIESISNKWSIETSSASYTCNQILVATGSSPATWKILKQLGHHIIDPVPSLFTFNIKHPLIDGLAGISVPTAEIVIKGEKIQETGALLITHWGLSGPAILKLSAWGARPLFDKKYQFEIEVNWVGMDVEDVSGKLIKLRKNSGKRKVLNTPLFGLPKRLWQRLISMQVLSASNFADLNAGQIESLINQITKCTFKVSGKSTFKDEFVTCGGIDTSEINFKTMESKIFPGLYFAGEVINIDAVTGGFNFQAAWTEAYIAAKTIAKTPGIPKDH